MRQTNIFTIIINTMIRAQISPAVSLKRSFRVALGVFTQICEQTNETELNAFTWRTETDMGRGWNCNKTNERVQRCAQEHLHCPLKTVLKYGSLNS